MVRSKLAYQVSFAIVAVAICYASMRAEADAPSKAPSPSGHWAFCPVRVAKPPTVQDHTWPGNEIDSFILAALEEKHLKPAPQADRHTLARRIYFDLTGLPPSPAEVTAFEKDSSADAYEKLVDRLLASPHYGERQARRWLDLARYADTNGADENYAFPNAWRYRDYVVRSLNNDLPYDRFVTEQIAGDLLSDESMSDPQADPAAAIHRRQDRLVATGFLLLGPKMLAEQDKPKLVMDMIDEQIDVTGQTFLGLTLGCARCHDHKFDPIPTTDYYALAGIFKSTKSMKNLSFVSEVNENLLPDGHARAEAEKFSAKIAALQSELAGLARDDPADVDQEQRAVLTAELATLQHASPLSGQEAMMVSEDAPVDVPVHLRGDHLTLGKTPIPRGFLTILNGCETPPKIDRSHSGRLELARWITDPANPLTARVMVNRIWQSHFGIGLVSTPSNFGLRGSPPSNPQLLDWLAGEFVRRGWSIKQMHRLMVLSNAYQMSSNLDPACAVVDPENTLLWRQNRRRLEAEPIRDALLSAGGNLDLTVGGTIAPPLKPKEKYNNIRESDPVYRSTRRAIYLPIVRSQMYDFFTIFDYMDAAIHIPARPVTTVAPQTLFMLNSEFVADEARLLAGRLLKKNETDSNRIDEAYQILYSRSATAQELSRGLGYLEAVRQSADPTVGNSAEAAWTRLCKVLLAANEFVYVN